MAKREMPKAPNTSSVEQYTTVDTVISTVGVVSGCTRLNVRSKPLMGSSIIDVVERDTKLTIDVSESTNDWYCVTIRPGVKGFCMRKFISVQ